MTKSKNTTRQAALAQETKHLSTKEHHEQLIQNLKAHISSGGRPVTYDPKKHLPLLVDVFARGEGIASYCAESLIVKSTFHEWTNKYPEFKTTYQQARNIGQRVWEKLGKDPTINNQYWRSIMKNCYGWDRFTIPASLKKDPAEAMQDIKTMLTDGEMSVDEAKKLAEFLLQQVELENISGNNGAEPFPREELDDKIEYLEWKKAKLLEAQDAEGKLAA